MQKRFLAKLVFCFLVTTILFGVSCLPVKAIVGVKNGDWIKYSISASWDTNVPNTPVPSYLADLEWVKYVIQNVVGNDITASVTVHYKNGTETSNTVSASVLTQTGEISTFFVQAQMNKGDNIGVYTSYGGTTESFPIDETVSRSYLGITRETNHIDKTFSSGGYDVHFVGYWDKTTGVAFEIAETFHNYYAGQYATLSISFTVAETSILSAFPFWMQWWFLTAIAVVICVVAVSVLLLRWHGKSAIVKTETTQNPPPPSPQPS
jgi:hypothetical protein